MISSPRRSGAHAHTLDEEGVAFDEHRQLMLIDTFGTADEDRWWDEDAYGNGQCLELSKEAVRQYYRSIGYYDALMRARKNGMEEPEIPPLPGPEVKKVSDLYIEMFERLTGESFR